jgi:hypothetical protein
MTSSAILGVIRGTVASFVSSAEIVPIIDANTIEQMSQTSGIRAITAIISEAGSVSHPELVELENRAYKVVVFTATVRGPSDAATDAILRAAVESIVAALSYEPEEIRLFAAATSETMAFSTSTDSPMTIYAKTVNISCRTLRGVD